MVHVVNRPSMFSSGSRFKGITVDSGGNIYLVWVHPDGFPVTHGAFDREFDTGARHQTCAVLAEVSPDWCLIYATYIGGKANDDAASVAVTPQGEAVMSVYVPDIPVTPGAASQYVGSPHRIIKMNADGSDIVYCAPRRSVRRCR